MFSRLKMAATLTLVGWLSATPALATPTTMGYAGRLLDSTGAAISSTETVRISLHTHPTAGTEVWFEAHTVDLEDGYFSVDLGAITPLATALRANGTLWVETAINGEAMSARTALNAAPYAIVAPGGLVSMQSLSPPEHGPSPLG